VAVVDEARKVYKKEFLLKITVEDTKPRMCNAIKVKTQRIVSKSS